MTETRAHIDFFFLKETTGKSFRRGSHDAICTFFSSMVTLKIHSTFPVRERRRKRSLHLIALYALSKKECLKKERQAFRCCLNKAMGMQDESSIWRFSNTGTWLACFLCCWRSEKLFPVVSHLVTSSTNILLLLAPAAAVEFLPLHRQMVLGL